MSYVDEMIEKVNNHKMEKGQDCQTSPRKKPPERESGLVPLSCTETYIGKSGNRYAG